MSNARTPEIPFLDAIASMTDAELAAYGRRYATATDSISVLHGNAVRAEMGRRAKAALAPQQTAAEIAAEMLGAQGTWTTPAEDYAHGVAIQAILAVMAVGTRVRGHQFRAGVVVGTAPSGMPIVRFDGDASAMAVHPGQLMTEAAYGDLIANALAK